MRFAGPTPTYRELWYEAYSVFRRRRGQFSPLDLAVFREVYGNQVANYLLPKCAQNERVEHLSGPQI